MALNNTYFVTYIIPHFCSSLYNKYDLKYKEDAWFFLHLVGKGWRVTGVIWSPDFILRCTRSDIGLPSRDDIAGTIQNKLHLSAPRVLVEMLITTTLQFSTSHCAHMCVCVCVHTRLCVCARRWFNNFASAWARIVIVGCSCSATCRHLLLITRRLVRLTSTLPSDILLSLRLPSIQSSTFVE